MSTIIAQFQDVYKIYSEGLAVAVHALQEASIDFIRGESVAILGPSGSGKSTMMNIIGCLDRPTEGRYMLDGVDVSTLNDDGLSAIRGNKLGFVFQNFNLIQQLTVIENLEVPLFYQGIPAHERRERAEELISLVGLADRSDHRPMELSGGQQQRVAIARALINDPVIVLADEPTGNLDTASGEVILEIFDRLHEEGKTIIMVTHETDVANRCDRLVTLRDGRIVTDIRNPERAPKAVSTRSAG